MTKLSPVQLAILRHAAAGVWFGFNPWRKKYVWFGGEGPRLNRRGVHILLDLGLVREEKDEAYKPILITTAGRKYLEENDVDS